MTKHLQILLTILTLSFVFFSLLQIPTNSSTPSKSSQKSEKDAQRFKELEKELKRLKNLLEKQEKKILDFSNINLELKEKNLGLLEENNKLKGLLTQLYQKQSSQNKLKVENVKKENSFKKKDESLTSYEPEVEGDIEGISKKLLAEYEAVSIGKTRENKPAFLYVMALGTIDDNQRNEVVELGKSYASELEVLKKKHNSERTDQFISELKNLQKIYYKLIFPILTKEQKEVLSIILRKKISRKTGK